MRDTINLFNKISGRVRGSMIRMVITIIIIKTSRIDGRTSITINHMTNTKAIIIITTTIITTTTITTSIITATITTIITVITIKTIIKIMEEIVKMVKIESEKVNTIKKEVMKDMRIGIMDRRI